MGEVQGLRDIIVEGRHQDLGPEYALAVERTVARTEDGTQIHGRMSGEGWLYRTT